MFALLKKMLILLDRRSRIQLALLLIPMLITAGLEMISIGMILPVISTLFSGDKPDHKVFSWIFSLLKDIEPERLLFVLTMGFVALFILKNAAFLLMTYIINRFTNVKLAAFLQRMFFYYLRRPYEFHVQRNSAETLRNLYTGTGAGFQGLHMGLNLVFEGTVVLVIAAFLFALEPMVTSVVGLTLLVVGTFFHIGTGPVFRRWGLRAHELEARFIRSINEGFGAIKDIKILNCYPYINRNFADLTNATAKVQIRSMTAQNLPRVVIEVVFILLMLGIGMVFLESRGSVQEAVSILGLFSMAALRLMPSTSRMLGNLAVLKNLTAPIETLHRDLTDSIAEGENLDGQASSGPLPFERDIRLENISYAYPSRGRKDPILQDVSFAINKGEAIGLVGPSGSGKTTLVNVLLGLLRPQSGRLMIDGADAFSNRTAWQNHLGYVPQDIYLIDDTLRNNITLGVEQQDVYEDRLRAAVGMAHLGDMIDGLEDGLETIVGEQGIRISGGQRQRIGIARALYRDPDVLFFDEATSSLDNETEREIISAIEELKGSKTMILVAHRLSTVRMCNRLIFMKDGVVNDVGSFEDLQTRNEDFRRMVKLGTLELTEPST